MKQVCHALLYHFGHKVDQSFCYVRWKGLCFQIISWVEFRCGLTFLSGVRRKILEFEIIDTFLSFVLHAYNIINFVLSVLSFS